MKRRRGKWLLVALLLFGVAAWLMRDPQADRKPSRGAAASVNMPRYPRSADLERARQRATLIPPVIGLNAEEGPAPRDPFLGALPSVGPKDDLLVLEANAIRYSPIGERLIACLSAELSRELAELKEETGFDPLEDIDRIGIVQGGAVISGHFAAGLLEHSDGRPTTYGEHGQLLSGGGDTVVALWKDELMIMTRTEADARAAIDRLERPDPLAQPALAEQEAYGELYGHLSPKTLLSLVPPESRERLEAKLLSAAQQIDLHATVDDTVGMVATIRGDPSPELTDLGKSLGAALAVGRVMAQAEGQEELAEILELARVQRQADGVLSAELALPSELLDKYLGNLCGALSGTSSSTTTP